MKVLFVSLTLMTGSSFMNAQEASTRRAARKEQRRIEKAVMDSIRHSQAEKDSVNVGYGYTKRKNMTTSVSRIAGENIQSYSDIGEYLMGRVPGLIVMKRGNSYSFQIRGAMSLSGGVTSPLVMVDGVETDDIGSLHPQNVRSVEVLKDAAASAIYGSRAASGVILITTKSR